MREVPLTTRAGRNVLRSKPRAQKGVKISNEIIINAMIDAKENRDGKRLASSRRLMQGMIGMARG